MHKFNNTISDISFIGAGISTSFTILSYLKELNNTKTINSGIVRITIIDKYPEFFKGIPYGKRSGNSVLLINSLRSFLPEPERSAFIIWLKENKKNLINNFLETGGNGAKLWYSNNLEAINSNNWENLFIPRSFFGKYITNKVNKAIEKAENKKLIKLVYITAEAINLNQENNIYKINLDSGENILSKKVVLALGSLPTKSIYSNELFVKKDDLLLINDIYHNTIDSNFKEIENFALERTNKETNILIIGANASGLEAFYKLNNNKIINNTITNYIILSTQGVIPDSKINLELKKEYIPKTLINLQKEEHLTAKQIAEATFLDLDLADKNNIGAATSVNIISKAFSNLLSKLNNNEKEIFACKYGNSIGRRQRCAGTHYTDVIYKSLENNKLKIIPGRFLDLEKNKAYKFKYLDTKTKKTVTSQNNIHLIINCTGSINLESKNIPLLIKNLIDKKYCTPNNSKIGFKINSNLETSKNLYVAGPLLAGNVIEGNPVWHLEHCGRIIWTSNLIGKRLIKQ